MGGIICPPPPPPDGVILRPPSSARVNTHVRYGDLRLFVAAAPTGRRRLEALKLLFILKMFEFVFSL